MTWERKILKITGREVGSLRQEDSTNPYWDLTCKSMKTCFKTNVSFNSWSPILNGNVLNTFCIESSIP